jgi:hypothetical protein
MKLRVLLSILAAILLAQICAAQTDVNKPILGVWRGTLDGLPAFTLNVTDESGELQGAILFYLIKREKPGDAPTVTPGVPGPIFHPVFDGKTLRFQVSHRGAHPPRTLNDPPVPFELTLAEDGQAVVENKFEGMTLRVTHSDY